MNHPLIAAASGVLFGWVLCTSAYLVHKRPSPLFAGVSPALQAPVPAAVVVAPPPTPVPSPLPAEPATVSDCADPDTTLSQAQTAYVNGDYADAIDLAELCSDVSPVRAMRIIGAASCVLHDLECLRTAYRQLDAPGRQYLVYVCQRNGVSFQKRGKHLLAAIDKE